MLICYNTQALSTYLFVFEEGSLHDIPEQEVLAMDIELASTQIRYLIIIIVTNNKLACQLDNSGGKLDSNRTTAHGSVMLTVERQRTIARV